MNKGTKLFACIALAIVVILLAYGFGDSRGYRAGMAGKKIQINTAAPQNTITISQKAATAATQAANPFKVENPLAGVNINPFEKAQKLLNPFE